MDDTSETNPIIFYHPMAKKEKRQKFETMSFEEICNLPKQEFIDRMEKLQNKSLQQITDLGNTEYADYTFEQKVDFWSSSLHQQMRRQAESGLDEYGIYSFQWYQSVLKMEPQFDLILGQVFKNADWEEWDKEEIMIRIKRKQS